MKKNKVSDFIEMLKALDQEKEIRLVGVSYDFNIENDLDEIHIEFDNSENEYTLYISNL
ncbi:hypothetical protein [Trichococcus flocculiformis]|jgi:hypothetical protein|uniref:hypothetical protein n=1 Tax=Trichococcus flocculiformis TaxID=82803 RepID=UPI003DA5BA06